MKIEKNERLLYKLTIVILTFNRPQYMLRSMKYWSGKGPIVHVLDGSVESISSKDLANMESNIRYHHMPVSYNERFVYAQNLSKSEYTTFIPDDEFLIPSALNSCISELDNNVSLVSCIGRCILFNHDKGSLRLRVRSVYEKMANYSVQHNNPDDRVLYHMKHYVPSMVYSVMRTNIWKHVLSCVTSKTYKVTSLEELQFEIASSYLGKSKVLPILMWLRSGENKGIGNDVTFKSINDWWSDSLNDNFREQMLDELTHKILANQDKTNISHVKKIIAKSFEMFIDRPKRQLPIKSIVIFQVARLLSMLPRVIKDILKRPAHTTYYNLNDFYDIDLTIKQLEMEEVSVNLDELKDIESTVVDFHNNLSDK